MNAPLRGFLILGLVAVTIWFAGRHAPHHESDSVFTTLFAHMTPAALVKDSHAPHDEQKHLLSISLPSALGLFDMDTKRAGVQLVLTNLQLFQVCAALLCIVCFIGLPEQMRKGRSDVLGRIFTGWAMWIRDEMVYPILGRDLGRRFLPYFLTLFFFVVFMNVLGLVPQGATATASIFVTGAMALTTLAVMIVGGMMVQGPLAFWKNLVPPVPGFLWPLMFLVELIGLMVKPFALMIRLFANMTGGHLVVLSFMGLIFVFGQTSAVAGWGVAPVAVVFASFIMVIEAFVALLQAYIFTQLSILFIGACLHPEH